MEKKSTPRFGRFTFLWALVIFLSLQISSNLTMMQGNIAISIGRIFVIYFPLVLIGILLYNRALKADQQNGIALRPFRNILLPWPKPAIGLLIFVLIEAVIVTPLYAYNFDACGSLDLIRKQNGCLMTIPHEGISNSVAFSNDGKVFATSEFEGKTQIWSYPSIQLIRDLGNQWDSVMEIALTSNGDMIAVCGYKGPMSILESKTGKVLHTLIEKNEKGCDVTFTPDDQLLISTSMNGLQIWDVPSGNLVAVLTKDMGDQIQISPDGSLVAIMGRTNVNIEIWRIKDRTLLRKIQKIYPQTMTFSSDGKYLISAKWDIDHKTNSLDASSTIQVWNIESGQIENSVTLQDSQIEDIASVKNGSGFVTGEGSCFKKEFIFGPSCVYFWETIHSKTPIKLLVPEAYAILFSPIDNHIFLNGYKKIYVWQVP